MRAGLAIGLAAGIGALFGLSSVAFVRAGGWSYFSADSSACVNCHLMDEQYRGWTRSTHRQVASCQDCHARRDTVGALVDNASRGLRHGAMALLGRDRKTVLSTARGRASIDAACRQCHSQVVNAITSPSCSGHERSCLGCHGSVGHLGAAGAFLADGLR